LKILMTGGHGDLGRQVAEVLQGTHKIVAPTSSELNVCRPETIVGTCAATWPFDALLVCHGASSAICPTTALEPRDFQRVIDVDLVGTFRVCQQALKFMGAAQHGTIIIVSSIHAIATYPQRAAYAAAKAGVVGLMRALAVEYARSGVRINAVLPGQVMNTSRTTRLLLENPQAIRARSPSGFLVGALAVAKAVEYLLQADGVTGHSLVVDEGWTVSAWHKSHVAH
jgi:NAD(P)-dependent dehydrogenase (short-subunit alcohol dehydrogenase family)